MQIEPTSGERSARKSAPLHRRVESACSSDRFDVKIESKNQRPMMLSRKALQAWMTLHEPERSLEYCQRCYLA
jgi:hypothetical protein